MTSQSHYFERQLKILDSDYHLSCCFLRFHHLQLLVGQYPVFITSSKSYSYYSASISLGSATAINFDADAS